MNLKHASPLILMSCIVVLSTLSGCGRSVAEVAAVPATSAESTARLRPSRLRERPDTGLAHLEQPTRGNNPPTDPARFPSDGRAQGAAAIFFFMMLQACEAPPHVRVLAMAHAAAAPPPPIPETWRAPRGLR